jgi:hypothetical protein
MIGFTVPYYEVKLKTGPASHASLIALMGTHAT